MRMNRRNLIRLGVTLAIIFILNLGDIVELRRNVIEFKENLGNDFSMIFNELLFGFYKADSGFNIRISQLAFLAAPPLFFGQSISADLSISATYFFTRQNNRAAWYAKRSLSLLGYSFIIAAFTAALNTLMTSYYDVGCIPFMRVAIMSLSLTLCVFVTVMLANIFGIFFGSIISVAAAVVYIGINALLVGTPIRAVSLIYNSSIISGGYIDMGVMVGINAAFAAAVFIIGLVTVMKKELGLVNAEQLF